MKPVIYVKEQNRQKVTLYEYESCYVVALAQYLCTTTEPNIETFPQYASSLHHLRSALLHLLL